MFENTNIGFFEKRDALKARLGLKSAVLLFILWPAGSFIRIFSQYRVPWAKDIFWLFTIFVGFTFVLGGDSVRMQQVLIMMHNSDYSLSDLYSGYLNVNTGMLDIVFDLITFVVSRFTDDYRFLLSALAVLFGYFLSRMIWFVIDHSEGRITFFHFLLLMSFALTIGMWDVHGRWNIAAVIFTYGIFNYFKGKRNQLYWIFPLSIFTHWSFIIAALIFFIYKVIGNRPVIYFIIFLSSFAFAQMEIPIVQNLFETFAPDPLLESRSGYFNDYYIETVESQRLSTNWYVHGHTLVLSWFILAFVIYLFYYKRETLKRSPWLYSLFNFSMFFFGLINSLTSAPSIGRFIAIGTLLFLGFLFLWGINLSEKLPVLLEKAGIFILILFMVVRIRIGFDYIGLWAVIGNPLTAWFTSNDLSLISIIKNIL